MLNVTQLFAFLPEEVYERSKQTILPGGIVTAPGMDNVNRPFAHCIVGAINKPPMGSGRLHKVELRIYDPFGSTAGVWASCSCEFFLYNCEVALSLKGSSSLIYSNGKLPIVKNPTYIPWLCKHSYPAVKRAIQLKKVKKALEKAKKLALP